MFLFNSVVFGQTYKMFLPLLLAVLCIKGIVVSIVSQEIAANDDIYRLSDSITPLYYDLQIAPNLQSWIFAGSVKITVQANVATKVIELHAKDLNINECAVTTKESRILSSKFHLDLEKDLLVIEFPRKLTKQGIYILLISYQREFSDRRRGFVNSSHEIDGIEKRFAFTNLEPNYAREVFPCFDEPKFRAPFTIHLARYTHQTGISNMPPRITTKDSTIENRVWDEFETTPAIPTYLVSFMVSELVRTSNPKNLIAIWARENVKDELDFSLHQSVQCLGRMEKMTAIPYMLPKLDMIAIPRKMCGAMENWGMIAFSERILITLKNDAFISKMERSLAQCNEIAHQWFGDLVTPEWWDYLWIKQGFAIYYGFTAIAKINPSWRTDELFVTRMVQASLWADVRNDRPITAAIKQKSQLKEVYDMVTHVKAPSVIRMLEYTLSTDSFRKFVHNFLTKGRDDYEGVVNQDRLFESLENQVKIDHISLPVNISISQMMRTWTENVGHPLITVTRDLIASTVKLVQTTYKASRAPQPQPDQKWIVPISYTTSSNPQFSDTKPKIWSLDEEPVQIPDEIPDSDWVLCNLQRTGYYRVNYDTYNWKLLIGQLMINHTVIHPLSRAQLLDDSFTLAYDGKISYQIPLNMALYLPQERDIIVWSAVLYNLLFAYGAFVRNLMQTPLGYFIKWIIENIFQSTGFKVKSTDSELIHSVRPQILQVACTVGLPACLKHAMDEYLNNKDDLNNIHQDLKLTVFQTALRYASDISDVENKLSSLYDEARHIDDKKTILLAAGSSGNQKFLKTILSKTAIHEIMEFFEKLNNFEALSSTNIMTTCLEKLDDQLSMTSELPKTDASLLQLLSARIDLAVQNETQLSLLKRLENKLRRFENKNVNLLESIKNVYISGKNTMDKFHSRMGEFSSVLMEVISYY